MAQNIPQTPPPAPAGGGAKVGVIRGVKDLASRRLPFSLEDLIKITAVSREAVSMDGAEFEAADSVIQLAALKKTRTDSTRALRAREPGSKDNELSLVSGPRIQFS